MTIWIGVDEAGYGPNLGPLVIGASVWESPDELAEPRFATVQASFPNRLGDSKSIYRSGMGLARLETGVLGALCTTLGRTDLPDELRRWRQVWQWLDPTVIAQLDRMAWYREFDTTVPIDLSTAELTQFVTVFRKSLTQQDLAIRRLHARAVFPEWYNQGVATLGSKGAALSAWTLELVADVLKTVEGDQIHIRCDKHGARNRYGAMLQRTFPDDWVEVRREAREESVYRWHTDGRRVEIRFTVKGERFLPTALASMTAKLLREWAMRAFNQYWRALQNDLRPTAGYPVDARRFWAAIEPLCRQLRIPDEHIWRAK